MPLTFSIIVATYDRPQMLSRALKSIQQQTVRDFECIVVDDASFTAGPVMIEDDRFRLISLSENAGLANAWNTGIAEARSDVVTFLDDDDLWTPERLALARECLEHAEIAVCGGDQIPASKRPNRQRILEGNVHDTILDATTPNMGRTAIARERMLPFDVSYLGSQDVEWWIRQSRGTLVASSGEIGHLHRRHEGQRHGNGTRSRIAASQSMLKHHADYFSSHPTARAFREYRIGCMLAAIGDPTGARAWLTRSLRSRPSKRAVAAYVRTGRR